MKHILVKGFTVCATPWSWTISVGKSTTFIYSLNFIREAFLSSLGVTIKKKGKTQQISTYSSFTVEFFQHLQLHIFLLSVVWRMVWDVLFAGEMVGGGFQNFCPAISRKSEIFIFLFASSTPNLLFLMLRLYLRLLLFLCMIFHFVPFNGVWEGGYVSRILPCRDEDTSVCLIYSN